MCEIKRLCRRVAMSAIALAAVACTSAPLEKDVDAAKHLVTTEDQVFHEWQKVYSVSAPGASGSRTHEGFLDRQFTRNDVDGKTFVVDRTHRRRGFILPGGKAFVFRVRGGEPVEIEDLGNTGFDNGVKRILQVTGAIEYERIDAASTRPPAES